MKYYEIHEPYYALVKACDKSRALKKYVEAVADDDGTLKENIEEVSQEYALARFSRAPGENRTLLPISDVIDEFTKQEDEVLIIDGALI